MRHSRKEVHFRGIHGGKSRFFDILAIIALPDLFLRYPGREIHMRHPGRKVLLSTQGGHFSFEAFREAKES